MFSKYELLFLDKDNFSSSPFQILQLQYSIPEIFLPPLPSLSNSTLANWNPSEMQSSSWSLSVFQFFINLYLNLFLPGLDNTVNKNAILNTKCTKFSAKWQVLFNVHNPTYACNHPNNLRQNSCLSILPLIVHKIILTIFRITLPFSKPQRFFISLFLRTAILTSVFPTSAI